MITSQWNIDDANSTVDMFKGGDINKLDRYLGCIHHLENDLKKKGELSKEEDINFQKLKFKKASVFIDIRPRFYFLNTQQFLICLKYFKLKDLLRLYVKLFKKGIRV